MSEKKYPLAIVCIIKDEVPEIAEWLDYNRKIGFSKVYLYDNGSTDGLKKFIGKYIEDGFVDYTWYPGQFLQLVAYMDGIKKHKDECKYIALIDADEFILPLRHEKLIDVVDSVFVLDSLAAGFVIQCKSFGSSGWRKEPDGLLENFCHRAPDGYDWTDKPWKWDAHVKSVVDPDKVANVVSPHYVDYIEGCYAINENGDRVDGMDDFSQKRQNRIRINHYFTKSLHSYVAKISKGLANVPGMRSLEEFYWRDRNDVFDDRILWYEKTLEGKNPIKVAESIRINEKKKLIDLLNVSASCVDLNAVEFCNIDLDNRLLMAEEALKASAEYLIQVEYKGFVLADEIQQIKDKTKELSNFRISEEDKKMQLQEIVESIRRTAEKIDVEIPARKVVVYVIHRFEEWEKIEEQWRRDHADPLCDEYVLPLPYESGEGELSYDGDKLPEYVPVMNFKAFDLKKLNPDAIYKC